MFFKRCAKVVLVSKAEHGADVLDRMPFIQQIERLLHLHNVIVFHNAHTHIFVKEPLDMRHAHKGCSRHVNGRDLAVQIILKTTEHRRQFVSGGVRFDR